MAQFLGSKGEGASPAQRNGIQGPFWTSWSALYRFARSPVAVYGTYAALLIPLLAHGIVFAEHVWLAANIPPPTVPVPGGSTPPGPGLAAVGPRAVDWRVFAAEFYVAGLFILIARLITDLFCPDRIQRFPFEDDHLVFIGTIKRAKLDMAEAVGEGAPDIAVEVQVVDDLTNLMIKERGDPKAANTRWRKDNYSRPLARFVAAGCYAVGASGVVLFLGWRSWENFGAVRALLPF